MVLGEVNFPVPLAFHFKNGENTLAWWQVGEVQSDDSGRDGEKESSGGDFPKNVTACERGKVVSYLPQKEEKVKPEGIWLGENKPGPIGTNRTCRRHRQEGPPSHSFLLEKKEYGGMGLGSHNRSRGGEDRGGVFCKGVLPLLTRGGGKHPVE